MRNTTSGLHRGARVRVTGAGKRGHGSISVEPTPGATSLYVRDDYSGSERLYPIERIRVVRPKVWRGEAKAASASADLFDAGADRAAMVSDRPRSQEIARLRGRADLNLPGDGLFGEAATA